MRKTVLSLFVFILALGPWALAQDAAVRDYSYFLKQLTDLDRLPFLEEGTTCKQFSSFDRGSYDPGVEEANTGILRFAVTNGKVTTGAGSDTPTSGGNLSASAPAALQQAGSGLPAVLRRPPPRHLVVGLI